MRDAHTLHRATDPFATLVDLTGAALTGRRYSPSPVRHRSESEASRNVATSATPRRPFLQRLDEWALTFMQHYARDLRPVASEVTRARELRVLYRYY